MTESFIRGPADSTGKMVRTSQQTKGANAVEEQYVRIAPQGGPDSVSFVGTATNRAVQEWFSLQNFTVPTGYFAQPLSFRALSATAAYGARAIFMRKLGTYNLGTNTYTDTGINANPGSYFAGVSAVVTTALSATATTLTVTYTRADGVTGRSGSIVLAASQPITSKIDMTMATRTDAFGRTSVPDVGVFDVTAVSEATAATGVVDIYGYDVIAYLRAVAANTVYTETFDPHLWAIQAGDVISVESNSYATAVAAIVQERQLLFQLTAL